MKIWRDIHRDEQGFTLIELMVVMIVLSTLSAIVMLAVNTLDEDAGTTTDRSNDRQCASAIELYRVATDGGVAAEWSDIAPYFASGTADPGCEFSSS